MPETNSFFVSDFVKEEILKRLVKSQELPSEAALLELPARVDVYIELLALEPTPGAASYSFNGLASSVYRATNSETGQLVCLRRFHAFTPSSANAKLLMATIDGWKKVTHANIVPLRQVFTTKAFGDNSVIFVYDYYPASETLMGAYFANQQLQPPNGGGIIGNSHVGGNGVASSGGGGGGGGGINGPGGPNGGQSQQQQSQQQQQQQQLSTNGYSTASRPYSQQAANTRKLLPEATIWNYIIQISSALRIIHQSSLACRALDPTKVLLTSGWSANANNAFSNRGRNARLRLAFAGVADILTLDLAFLHHHGAGANPRALVAHFQQEDLLLFGRLCLALATNSLAALSRHLLAECLELVPRSYSADLRTLIGYLLSSKATANPNKPRSIDDIMPMIGARFYMQLDHLYYRYDHLYEELAKEADNGRLLRLLAKLGTINERPEHQLDPNWSETGDRYMLKLFRDYLFHQCDEEGRPWLDLGHIITNLNKMDVGSGEKICLVSRDAQNVLIVSFEELKRCFEAALADLMQ
ncbi:PREDICTED: PAB-dependent poly(A)-specific ribonuclease subunit PAN3-like [Rhagoletis zephyria]|uniref:PAB-dependent poly(A)-specific ribonuclease subunit PAN3-like n=1 Tax=Rhagoletis zephyria TaxID=28612 RepID=UPI0008119BCA|nr:PREDICTED: PAB-dependent poly(A)-specific ribonuclease subunit PAN3-like [Rhagoletis zephyria]